SCPDPRPGSAWPGRLRRGPSRPRRAVRPGQKPACRLAGRSGLAFPAWLAVWSGGQHPDSVVAGQAPAGQVPQVQGGGAALEPGVVPVLPAVAELEAASPPGGDLGDGAFDVGPVFHVVLAQPGAGGPVPAGGGQQVIALVQDDLAAGLAGGAACPQRAVAAQRAEGGDPGSCAARIFDCVADLCLRQQPGRGDGWLAGCYSRSSTCWFAGYPASLPWCSVT